jgi:hypothetical protein
MFPKNSQFDGANLLAQMNRWNAGEQAKMDADGLSGNGLKYYYKWLMAILLPIAFEYAAELIIIEGETITYGTR